MNQRYTIGIAALTLAIAIGVVSSGDAQGPVVLRNSSGQEIGIAARALRIDPTGSTTQPVSGTVSATVSGTVTANAGSGTMAVSAASLPLPTGAATETTLATLLPSSTFTGRMPAGASPANGESNTNTNLSRIGSFNYTYNGSTWDRWTGAVSQGTAAAAASRWPFYLTDGTNTMPTMDVATRAGFFKLTDGTNTQPTGDTSARAIYVQNPDPCFASAKTPVVVNISTATTTQLMAASASNFNYICSLNLVAGAADNVALVESTAAACASSITGMAGGATAATGWNFPANGGLTFGNGQGTVFKTAATNRYTCLITSGAVQLSGSLTYVQVP